MAKSQKIASKYINEIIIGIIVLLTYVPALIWMWDRWFARDSYYSHGILVPFVTAFLIWQKKDVLSKIKAEPSHWGMKLFTFGLAVHLVSAMFQVYFSSGFSMILVLMGLVLHFYGTKMLKEILFPLSFLIFMVPLPMVAITNLSFRLKLMAANIAVGVLEGMRIESIQQGSTIIMHHAHVVVDDVCSGLRSLISLTALSAIFAYFTKAAMWKRIVLFLSAIPIAVITNVVRIVFLAAISEIWGTQYATGFTHDFSGFLVFFLAFVLLFSVGKAIE